MPANSRRNGLSDHLLRPNEQAVRYWEFAEIEDEVPLGAVARTAMLDSHGDAFYECRARKGSEGPV